MKFSESWLRELVNPDVGTDVLTSQLTMAGLEVDSTESARTIEGPVVVGQILAVEAHPQADKLSVCGVKGHAEEIVQVVCGAFNARVGVKIPFAQAGSVLPGELVIETTILRGVDSHGMLCSQKELGLGDDDTGLWELPGDAPVGQLLTQYLSLEDTIIEVDLTPNRGDCLSLKGLSREVGVLNKQPVREIEWIPIASSIKDKISIDLEIPHASGRYVGRILKDLDQSKGTPLWMREKLRRSGLRSLGPVVDATNYVMLELGQPMHSFDLSRIDGGIVVRMGAGEKLKLLDDTEVIVDDETLVIADHAKPLALAGIMGGCDSSVSATTNSIVLESAWFNPLVIAGKARGYGKHTDSSHRFERGVDPTIQVPAIERATSLIIQICGGSAGPIVLQESEHHLPKPAEIKLNDAWIEKQLGIKIDREETDDILSRLGLERLSGDPDGGSWLSPPWRFDLGIQQDLVEEIARIYGYDNLPATTPTSVLAISSNTETKGNISELRQRLTSRGYREVMTYSFTDPEVQFLLDPDSEPVSVKNPISAEMSKMRTNLWPGLVGAARYNLNRQQSRIKIFEVGQCFYQADGERVQKGAIGGLICGLRAPTGWASQKDLVDFYDVKGDIEALLMPTRMHKDFDFVASRHAALHPGQTASILFQDFTVGWVGQLHPMVQNQLNLISPVFLFQIDLNYLLDCRLPKYKDTSKYPEIRRDLAFLVEREVKSSSIIGLAREAAGDKLIDIELFDVYEGLERAQNLKSLAITLTFQHPDRTLSDDEVNSTVEHVAKALNREHGAKLRG